MLSQLVKDWESASQIEDDTNSKYWEIADRIVIPKEITNYNGRVVELNNNTYLKGPKAKIRFNGININGLLEKETEAISQAIQGVFDKAKRDKFPGLVGEVFWTAEDFLRERSLKSRFLNCQEIKSEAYSADPTRLREDFSRLRPHYFRGVMQGREMQIETKGNYRGCLERVIEQVRPQLAALMLSKGDAERVFRRIKNSPVRFLENIMNKALAPQERLVLGFSDFGAVKLGTREIIKIVVPASQIQVYEEIIGKSLLFPLDTQESQVIQLIKRYGWGRFITQRRLEDMQAIVGTITGTDLGINYGHPIITDGEAGDLIDKEIEKISKMAASRNTLFGDYLFLTKTASEIVRLSRDHFGDKILEGLEMQREDTQVKYIESLKRLGYQTKKEFREDEKTAKMLHLFEFFKQSYNKDPRKSVQIYKESYINRRPELTITTNFKGYDIPSQARINTVGIHSAKNLLTICRRYVGKQSHINMRIIANSPTLLKYQEYVCEKLGIIYK